MAVDGGNEFRGFFIEIEQVDLKGWDVHINERMPRRPCGSMKHAYR